MKIALNWGKALYYIVKYAPVVVQVIQTILESQHKDAAPADPKVAAFLSAVGSRNV